MTLQARQKNSYNTHIVQNLPKQRQPGNIWSGNRR